MNELKACIAYKINICIYLEQQIILFEVGVYCSILHSIYIKRHVNIIYDTIVVSSSIDLYK